MMDLELERQVIDKYLGIPYKHMGRDAQDGLDCWGLIKCVYADLGYDIWDPVTEYTRNFRAGENHLLENYHKEWVKVISPHSFDVVLFVNCRESANHAGIVLSLFRFMHACRAGVVINRFSDPKWRKRINGYYRFRKIAQQS